VLGFLGPFMQFSGGNKLIGTQELFNKRRSLFLYRFIHKVSRNVNEAFGSGRAADRTT
jgi:hypothetical protein